MGQRRIYQTFHTVIFVSSRLSTPLCIMNVGQFKIHYCTRSGKKESFLCRSFPRPLRGRLAMSLYPPSVTQSVTFVQRGGIHIQRGDTLFVSLSPSPFPWLILHGFPPYQWFCIFTDACSIRYCCCWVGVIVRHRRHREANSREKRLISNFV